MTSIPSWNRVREMVDIYCNNTISFKMSNQRFMKNQSKLIMVMSAAIYANNTKKTNCMESQQDVNSNENINK